MDERKEEMTRSNNMSETYKKKIDTGNGGLRGASLSRGDGLLSQDCKRKTPHKIRSMEASANKRKFDRW